MHSHRFHGQYYNVRVGNKFSSFLTVPKIENIWHDHRVDLFKTIPSKIMSGHVAILDYRKREKRLHVLCKLSFGLWALHVFSELSPEQAHVGIILF